MFFRRLKTPSATCRRAMSSTVFAFAGYPRKPPFFRALLLMSAVGYLSKKDKEAEPKTNKKINKP